MLIFEILLYSLLTVFLLLTIRILFVFTLNFKKNKVINKSVSKSVFSGKLSLLIILMFFGISFSLVGGTQLLAKNTQRSIEKQYTENNLYQIELSADALYSEDTSQLRKEKYYNIINFKNTISEEGWFIKPWIIENTLDWKNVDETNGYDRYTDENGNPYWNIHLSMYKEDPSEENLINTAPSKVWKNDEHYQSYGWSTTDWTSALKSDLIERFKGSKLEDSWGEDKSKGADTLINTIFGNWINYGKAIAMARLFNDDPILHPGGKFLYPLKTYTDTDDVYSSTKQVDARKVIEDYDKGVSYNFTSYMNVTPNSKDANVDFEIKLINDIDWTNGHYLFEEENPDDVLLKEVNGREINKSTYIDEGKSREDFLGQSKALNSSQDGYKVLVQKDFYEKNKGNDEIDFMNLTKFKTYSPVYFNEITYPAIGFNVLPDESKQAFLGMSTSDYIDFYNNYGSYYSSLSNIYNSVYLGTEDGYEELSSLKSWEFGSKQFDKILLDFEDVETNGFRKVVNPNAILIKKNQIGSRAIAKENSHPMNDYDTLSSIWAYTGVVQIQGTQKMINVIVGIFMVIVLIVISMLTSKRIKSSGKQIGTLKALGMSNKSIASAYTIFPMIIIFFGFIIASILSIPVMMIFTNLMSNYYYITFSSNPISLMFFLLLLFIPMVLAIGLTYLISIKTLKKPTIDLLNNTNANSPNILVRASGYLTPINTPFEISYMNRGALRAVGKSTLLFGSIFLATLLTGFSMAATTMVEKQTKNALKYLNFDIHNHDTISDRGQYERKPLWVMGEDGKYHKAYEYGDGKETPIDISNNMMNWNINMILNNSNNSIDVLSSMYQNEINNTIWNVVGDKEIINYTQDKGPISNFYFTNHFMEAVTFGYIGLSEYSHITGENFGFSSLTLSPYLPSMIKAWSSSLIFNYIYSTEDTSSIKINSIKDLQKIVDEYGNDTFIMEKFYDQFTHSTIYHSYSFLYNDSINYKGQKGNFSNSAFADFNIASNIDEMENSFGSIDTNIGQKVRGLFQDDLDYISEDPTHHLDYIPVILTTQAQKKINENVKKENIIQDKDHKDQYVISTQVRTTSDSERWAIKSDNRISSEYTVLTKIKVVGKPFFAGPDVGINTTMEFYKDYFEHYSDHDFFINGEQLETDYSPGSFLEKDDKNDVYKIHGYKKDSSFFYDNIFTTIQKEKGTYFNTRKSYEFRLRDSKNLPSDDMFVTNKKGKIFHSNLMSTSSILFSHKEFDNITRKDGINNNNYTVGCKQLFSKDEWGDIQPIYTMIGKDKIDTGEYFSDLVDNDSLQIPLKSETLLSQGKAMEQMMISMLTVISLFAIFMAVTIIIISVKDIIDSSKREVSMLKAFGYSNRKSSILIIVPYVVIIILAFAISLPLTFLSLSSIALILTEVTGNTFRFTLTIIQSLILTVFILGIVLLLLGMSYISFKKTDALEAIKLTDE